MANRLGNSLTFLQRGLYPDYQRYLKTRKVAKENRPANREELIVILKTIFKHISNNIVEKKAGVLIKGFGYMYMWLMPRKTPFTLKVKGEALKERYNHHTNQRIYTFIYQPPEESNFRCWSMDGFLARDAKRRLKHKILNEGVRYKSYPYSLKTLI